MGDLNNISFTQLTEYFLREIRSGKQISVEDLAAVLPQFSDRILQEFPTIQLLEQTIGQQKQSQELTIGVNSSVGDYKLIQELGRGGMGVVYRAQEKNSNRLVAIKIIPVLGINAHKLMERIQLERRAMSRLDHPHVVPVYSFGHQQNFAYLVMQFIDGTSLDQLVDEHASFERKKLLAQIQSDMRAVAQIGIDAASGLAHAHRLGLVHRDIKPANLLLDMKGHTYITDFGLAKIYDYAASLSGTGEIVGTPRYMAPEQMRGIADERTDIYSLGLSLYELATGQRVWVDTINSTKLPPVRSVNPHIPEPLAEIIDKACDLDPQKRFQQAVELQVVLTRFCEGLQPVDRRRQVKRPTNERFQQICRRNLKLAWIAGGVSLAICLMLGLLWWIQPGAKEPLPYPEGSVTHRHAKAYDKFVTQLAEGQPQEVVGAVGEMLKETMAGVVEKSPEVAPEVKKFEQKVDEVVAKFNREGITNDDLDSIVNQYRNSALPLGAKIMEVCYPLSRSKLNDQEKQMGFMILQRFAKLVVNKHLSVPDAERIFSGLYRGRVPKMEDIRKIKTTDDQLRSWLAFVETSLRPMLNTVADETPQVQRELEVLLDSYLKQQPKR